MKKFLLSALALVTVAALAITGTIAWLQDDDSDVNVMTVGNVYIDQHEYEREVDANGDYKIKDGSYVLTDFKQGKPLLPATEIDANGQPYNFGAGDYDSTRVKMSQVDSHGSMDVFTSKNAQDKFVTVENTGTTDAYVRTIIAFEIGSLTEAEFDNIVRTSSFMTQQGVWKVNDIGIVEIDGNKYFVSEYLYNGAKALGGVHENGVLPAGDTTYPSLCQVYMTASATNADVEAIDGNNNGKYDILVLSQAVQTAGFDSASTALDTAFGKSSEKAAEWFSGVRAKHVPDLWDGSVDTTWYNNTDTEFTITTAEQMAGLAELVDDGNSFSGQTVKLGKNLDLYAEDANGEPISFEPIGSLSDNEAFEGTFDGQGYTISNLYQNGWALANGYWDGPEYGMGLFSLVENATVKNLNFEGASLPTEANIIGVVAGGAANCVFENINITGAYLGNHSWYSGGVIGWAEGDVKLINCDIDATSVVSSQWGDFNNANGGLIGGIDATSTIYLKDCDVACVIDAYNDVTSAYEWYSYRNCGMLIGDTAQKDDPDGNDVGDAIAPNLTCENVTVTYGTWANYHYCEFGSSGYPFCRVEAGESTGAYGNARVGEYFDANGNKVVDNNHAHNTGEKHNELIVFDQLYGGATGDRYCTYGTATHPGVTVVYNNK